MKKILTIFYIFFTALFFASQAQGNIFGKKTQFLKSHEAFQFSGQQEGKNLIFIGLSLKTIICIKKKSALN